MSSEAALGPVVESFTRKNPLRLVLVLIPGFAVLAILLMAVQPDNAKAPAMATRVSVIAGALAAIGLYVWLRRRFGGAVFGEIYERGFRFRNRSAAWKDVASITTVSMPRLGSITTVHRRDLPASPIQISGAVYGDAFPAALQVAARAHKVKVG